VGGVSRDRRVRERGVPGGGGSQRAHLDELSALSLLHDWRSSGHVGGELSYQSICRKGLYSGYRQNGSLFVHGELSPVKGREKCAYLHVTINIEYRIISA